MRYLQLAVTIWMLIGAGVNAQAPVYDPKQVPIYDAGALARQAELYFNQSQMQRNQQKREALPPEMVLDDTLVVTVKRFKFNGNKLLSTEQLLAVAAPFADKPLKKQDLQHLTDVVTEAYRKIGWIVPAYIPRQDLSGVEMTLQVMETMPPSRPVH